MANEILRENNEELEKEHMTSEEMAEELKEAIEIIQRKKKEKQ